MEETVLHHGILSSDLIFVAVLAVVVRKFDIINSYMVFFVYSHIRSSLSPSDELRVDTKTAEQSCSLFGLDMVS